jgi:hypothetical protein
MCIAKSLAINHRRKKLRDKDYKVHGFHWKLNLVSISSELIFFYKKRNSLSRFKLRALKL